jgi:hypothetical protein
MGTGERHTQDLVGGAHRVRCWFVGVRPCCFCGGRTRNGEDQVESSSPGWQGRPGTRRKIRRCRVVTELEPQTAISNCGSIVERYCLGFWILDHVGRGNAIFNLAWMTGDDGSMMRWSQRRRLGEDEGRGSDERRGVVGPAIGSSVVAIIGISNCLQWAFR